MTRGSSRWLRSVVGTSMLRCAGLRQTDQPRQRKSSIAGIGSGSDGSPGTRSSPKARAARVRYLCGRLRQRRTLCLDGRDRAMVVRTPPHTQAPRSPRVRGFSNRTARPISSPSRTLPFSHERHRYHQVFPMASILVGGCSQNPEAATSCRFKIDLRHPVREREKPVHMSPWAGFSSRRDSSHLRMKTGVSLVSDDDLLERCRRRGHTRRHRI